MSKKTRRNKHKHYLQKNVKQGQKWEELSDLHSSISTAIIKIVTGFNECIKSTVAIDASKDKQLIPMVRSFERDINIFVTELNSIKSKHESKQGFVTNENDLIEMFKIHSEYAVLFEKFQSITGPIMLLVSQEFEEAYHSAKQNVSDAEIVEETTKSEQTT